MDNKFEFDINKVLKKIRDFRKSRGLSHENMAFELGISPSAYNKLERGETILSLERVYKISLVLEVNLSEILGLNFENQFNQTNKDNSTGHLYHQQIQQIENFYQDSKDVYEKLISSKEEQIKLLNLIIEKNNFK